MEHLTVEFGGIAPTPRLAARTVQRRRDEPAASAAGLSPGSPTKTARHDSRRAVPRVMGQARAAASAVAIAETRMSRPSLASASVSVSGGPIRITLP